MSLNIPMVSVASLLLTLCIFLFTLQFYLYLYLCYYFPFGCMPLGVTWYLCIQLSGCFCFSGEGGTRWAMLFCGVVIILFIILFIFYLICAFSWKCIIHTEWTINYKTFLVVPLGQQTNKKKPFLIESLSTLLSTTTCFVSVIIRLVFMFDSFFKVCLNCFGWSILINVGVTFYVCLSCSPIVFHITEL